MNNENKQQNKGGDGANNNTSNKDNGGSNQSGVAAAGIVDPYAVLNVSNDASIEEIQKSYKLLSRSFHPDKQPERSRQQAQEYFVQLKGAYDILMDPVCKFALDHFGYDGVSFVRRHVKLYRKISLLLQQRDEGNLLNVNTNVDVDVNSIEQKAKFMLSEAMQHYNYQMTSMKMKKPTISGSVKVKCNTTHSHLLQEGIEPITLDVDQTSLELSISDPIHTGHQSKNNVGVTCSASSTLKTTTGEGATNGQISFQYEPVQGTEVLANISSGINMSTIEGKQKQDPKIMLSTSRFMSNRTYVNASLAAPLKSMFNFVTLQPQQGNDNDHGVEEGSNDREQKEDERANDWMVTLTTHRSLFEDKIRCTWIAGIALPSTKMQYGMLSMSTNDTKNEEEDDDDDDDDDTDDDTDEKDRDDTKSTHDNDNDNDGRSQNNRNQKKNQSQKKSNKDKFWSKPAKHTLKLNFSMNHTPIQFITEKKIAANHTGKAYLGYGPYGFDIRLFSIRSLSKFCQFTLGVGHLASAGGLSTMFRIDRGSLSFTVPVLVSTKMSPAYAMKSIYVTLFMSLVDQVVGDIVNEDYLNIANGNGNVNGDVSSWSSPSAPIVGQPRTHEDILVEREKMKRDRLQQTELMRKSAEAKMKKEEMKEDDGLVIIRAKYEVSGGESIDVTIALQFWVVNSSLHLPSMSKSSMLGFYDVRHEVPTKLETGFWNAWRKALTERFFAREIDGQREVHDDLSSIPTLTVRYRYGGKVHEITVYDHEELSLPSPHAMTLGGAYVT